LFSTLDGGFDDWHVSPLPL
jgi:hypothetical protein